MKNKTDNQIKNMLKRVMIITTCSGFVTLLGTFVDNVMIGKYLGAVSVSACSLATPVLLFCIAISSIFNGGGRINVTRYLGAGNTKAANNIFTVVTITIAIIGILIGGVLFFANTPIALLLGAGKTPDLLNQTSFYIKGLAFGMPALMIMFCMTSYLQLEGDNIKLFISMGIMLLSNVAGDIVGLAVLKGNLFHVAIATSVSNILGFIVVCSHFFGKRSIFRVNLRKLEWKDMRDVVVRGMPSAMQRIYSATANLGMNLIVLSLAGVTCSAAQAVRGNVSAIFLTVGSSLGLATTTVAGLLYGEEDRAGLQKAQKIALDLALKTTLVMAVILFFCAEPVAYIFLPKSPEALAIARQALRIFSFAIPFSAICDVMFGYYQAIGRSRLANVIPLLEYLVLPIGLSSILGRTSLRENGIWIAYPLAEVLTLVVLIIIISVMNRRLSIRPEDMVVIPEGIGVADTDLYEGTVVDLNSVVEASKETFDFALEKSGDKIKAQKLSIAVEELGKNVVEHGFPGVAKPNLTIRVMWKNGEFILCMKDNCKAFDPKKKYRLEVDKYLSEEMGLKIVFGICDNIEYSNTLNMNCLRITI